MHKQRWQLKEGAKINIIGIKGINPKKVVIKTRLLSNDEEIGLYGPKLQYYYNLVDLSLKGAKFKVVK